MSQQTQDVSVHDRIMRSALDLFYRQGYRSTGINQLISESGVAKASFFSHFPSKEDLLRAYAAEQLLQDQRLRFAVETRLDPEERFFAPLRILIPWLTSTHFRGCPFQILAAEAGQIKGIRELIARHRDQLRTLFDDITDNLSQQDVSYAHLNAEKVSETYLLLFEGAITNAVGYQSVQPVNHAISAMRHHIQSRAG